MTAEDSGPDLVVDFLMSKNPELKDIDPQLDLIENRIIDSLHFVEFLYLLEQATGEEILLEEVSPDDFRTIAGIRARFLNGSRVS